MIAASAVLAGCSDTEFKYTVDQFADCKIIRYTVPGWDDLTFKQKEYVYHLCEAAKWGRDILWDQNNSHNLAVRHAVEAVIEDYKGDRSCEEFAQFMVYAKRLFFCNGVNHHYSEDKFFPECSKEYFSSLLAAVGKSDAELVDFVYDKADAAQRRCTSSEGDIVAQSGVNYYEGVGRAEVEEYYSSLVSPDEARPLAFGLNTKVVKEGGLVVEKPWCVQGLYSEAITKICEELRLAQKVAENEAQARALGLLIEYYQTGDLATWDAFNVAWVQENEGMIDFVNGFIEDYNDPLGRKGSWEGHVNIKDVAASERTRIMAANAQWFEDNSPVDPRFKKAEVKGVTAKVINAVCLAGDAYPATPIGINLPNADWIRKEYGSKSVSIANITHAYDYSANEQPVSMLNEFAYDEAEIELARKYGSYASEIHTDLHECLGHGSGQLLPGVSSTAMGEFSSALEESRADLFGLYYSADPKLVELGIMPSLDAYKAEYASFIRNGLFTQFTRVELGRQNTEAHMQDRQLISEWCYKHGKGAAADGGDVIERVSRDSKTYFVIRDYEALRGLFGELLAEVQRIKSEGDYEAGRDLVLTYGVQIDPELHREVLERYASLGLKPYGGFLNPSIEPVKRCGRVVDYKITYPESYVGQHMEYGKKYGILKK